MKPAHVAVAVVFITYTASAAVLFMLGFKWVAWCAIGLGAFQTHRLTRFL